MTSVNVDLARLTKLISEEFDLVTCIECCKYYVAPATAVCGHTLCHPCWRNHRTCPICAKPFERRNLRQNRPIQNLTQHVQALVEAYEKLFNINIQEILMDAGELESENDPTKNVKEWLASSQNHFSVPALSSEQSSQEIQQHPNPLIVSANKIQIHTNTPKAKSPEKVICVPIPQDDWDKIEPMPDTEDIKKDKENVVGPMDIEPFYIDENEYTVNNPRRSSRKKELIPTEINNKMNENSPEKQSCSNSSGKIDKRSNKTKQNWNNVKRMRKEFSKLNKKNRNKLNVSIEMYKKTQSTANTYVLPKALSSQVYDIDENTPNKDITELSKELNEDIGVESPKINTNEAVKTNTPNCNATENISNLDKDNNTHTNKNDSQLTNAETIHSTKHEEIHAHNATEKMVRLPFYKRSALQPKCQELKEIETRNYIVNSNTAVADDDIEITIKAGNTITNILITKKNDVELKINTDREIQTSLDPNDLNEKRYVLSSEKTKTQNFVINVGDNHIVDVEHQPKTNPRIKELKDGCASDKSLSEKKNTDSDDTTTAQFEITESVEKELSKVMDCVEIHEPIISKNIISVEKDSSQNNKSQKPTINPDDHDYLNDLDIFDSEPVKEADVQLLKDTEHAPSEILLCTVKTKSRTQKLTGKRGRDVHDKDILPESKRLKLNLENTMTSNDTIKSNKNNQNKHDSEPISYDEIMGTVFATIDADIEEIRQSQGGNKNPQNFSDRNKDVEYTSCKTTQKKKDKEAQNDVMLKHNEMSSSIQQIRDYCNQKNSENIFSVCVEKEDDKVDEEPVKEKVHMPTPNVEEFLTPVIRQNIGSTSEALVDDNDIEMVNDDSDKSIVEETPQKTTSFVKMKQKSNGTINKELNVTQNLDISNQKRVSDKKSDSDNVKSIVNLSDSLTEVKSGNDVTAIEAGNKKSFETPLTINKFANEILHKSTPYARKSLHFDSESVCGLDPEQTLCPTNDAIAKTTQEKEFMNKAFEKTPTTSAVRPLQTRSLALRNKKYKIAGSCLTASEIGKLKLLCARHKWSYTDKFSKDLTHLVVGVDKENKSQRSVKYLCAVASSIWIISYEWVEKCLISNDVVSEEYFESLDSTGEPGPKRSRTASNKLFEGITFFCMEPFSILDISILKEMIEAAGGKVVNELREVSVTDETRGPAILMAEYDDTQDDRFIYLAMERKIVPVGYGWFLNCLGSYTLSSIQESLLCPASLLPKPTQKWPRELMAQDED